MGKRKEDEDGAAFRLLVSRALTVMVDPEDHEATAIGWGGIVCSEPFKDKAEAMVAARRAVIAAAAEVDRRYRTPGVTVRGDQGIAPHTPMDPPEGA